MFSRHVSRSLPALCRGELETGEAARVEAHLARCARCRAEREWIGLGHAALTSLPPVAAPAGLWQRVETALDADAPLRPLPRQLPFGRGARWAVSLATLSLAAGLAATWFLLRPPPAAWSVESLAGAPRVNRQRLGPRGRLPVGGTLVTDAGDRALVSVADVGTVEVEPNSRLQLLRSQRQEHRLALERGKIHAMIYAPPRLFFVDTPSAVAVDLGCSYDLEVDDGGGGLLRVRTGWVSLARGGRETVVPGGAVCRIRPGLGPGTPCWYDAPPALRQALDAFDFAGGGSAAVEAALAAARPEDTLTFWELFARAPEAMRGRILDWMARISPPPAGVTRAGVLGGDATMLEAWKQATGDGW